MELCLLTLLQSQWMKKMIQTLESSLLGKGFPFSVAKGETTQLNERARKALRGITKRSQREPPSRLLPELWWGYALQRQFGLKFKSNSPLVCSLNISQ